MAIVGKRTLNGNANALVGPNGTWGGTESYVEGKSGLSGSFNGSSYISLGSNTILPNTGDYSIRGFITPGNTSQSYGMIFLQEKLATTQHSKAIAQDGATLKYLNSNNTAWVSTSVTLNTSTYYNFTYVFSATAGGKMYINGNLVGSDSQTATNTNPFGVNQTSIGYRENANYFTGTVDELILDNTALTPAEVKNDYLFYNGFI